MLRLPFGVNSESAEGNSGDYVVPQPPGRRSFLRRRWWLALAALPVAAALLLVLALNPSVPEAADPGESRYHSHHPDSVSRYVLAVPGTRVEGTEDERLRLLPGGVVQAEMPGLRAYGWSLIPQDRFFQSRRVDRLSWYREQSKLFQRAVYGVYAPVYIMAETPFQYRTSILARRVYDLTVINQDGYAGGHAHWWRLAPSRFICDSSLNSSLHQGLEADCPGPDELIALSMAWRDLGRLNTSMMAYAQVMLAVPDQHEYNYYRDETLAELAPRLRQRMRDFDDSRQTLANLYHRYGASVHVIAPQSLVEVTAALVSE